MLERNYSKEDERFQNSDHVFDERFILLDQLFF